MAEPFAALLIPPTRPGPYGRLSPAAKLALLLLCAAWVILVDHPVALLVPVVLIAVLVSLERLRLMQLVLFAGVVGLVMIPTIIGQGFFYQQVPRTILFTLIPPFTGSSLSFPGLQFSAEGWEHGKVQSLRLVSMVTLGVLTTITSPAPALLGGMRAWGIPGSLGLLVLIAVRSLPVLVAEALLIRKAMRWRRLTLRRVGFAGVLRPLLAQVLRRATLLAASLQMRGIDPVHPVLGFTPRIPPAEKLLLATLTVIVLTAGGLRVLLLLYWQGIWYQPDWRSSYELAALLAGW